MLPLRNVSGDPAQEYFADGMTEAIISDLARIKALRVISRTSAMQYKGSTLRCPRSRASSTSTPSSRARPCWSASACASACSSSRARTDETLWADRYDRDLEDVLGLQSDLAATVAHEIAIQLTPAEERPSSRSAPR